MLHASSLLPRHHSTPHHPALHTHHNNPLAAAALICNSSLYSSVGTPRAASSNSSGLSTPASTIAVSDLCSPPGLRKSLRHDDGVHRPSRSSLFGGFAAQGAPGISAAESLPIATRTRSSVDDWTGDSLSTPPAGVSHSPSLPSLSRKHRAQRIAVVSSQDSPKRKLAVCRVLDLQFAEERNLLHLGEATRGKTHAVR